MATYLSIIIYLSLIMQGHLCGGFYTKYLDNHTPYVFRI
jgi:hypothetical protein